MMEEKAQSFRKAVFRW